MFSNTPASKSWMKGEILKKMKDYTTYADEGKKKKIVHYGGILLQTFLTSASVYTVKLNHFP